MPGDVNFYLKKAEEKTGKSLIYLKFKYSGNVLVYTFGQTVDPVNWNISKQRVKSNRQTTKDGQFSLNDLMDNLSEVLLATYRKELATGVPPRSKLKEALNNFIFQNQERPDRPTLFKLIDRFIGNEIKYKGQNKADNTLDKYKTVKGHLLEFQTKKKYPIDFESINLDFFYSFLSFLQAKGLSPNTIAKDIQVIKTFMNEAFDLGYTKNVQHKHRKFSAAWVDVDAVYITDREIMKLWEYDLSNNKKLEQVKDLFIFGCCTGLRFSDYSDVKPENIITIDGDLFLKVITKKTGQLVIIPCNPLVLQIFEKYANSPNRLPKAPALQKFNEKIKAVCRAAGLTEKGRLVDDPEKELWEAVSSHSARRSFATNLYLQGYFTIEIMKITAHKTEKAFLKYIKVSKLDAAKKLQAHMRKNWSEKILKVA